MLRPGGSSLSLRAIGSSLRNLNSISNEHLDERILLLMPSINNKNEIANDKTTTRRREYGDKLSVSEFPYKISATMPSRSVHDLSPSSEDPFPTKSSYPTILVGVNKNDNNKNKSQEFVVKTVDERNKPQDEEEYFEQNAKESEPCEGDAEKDETSGGRVVDEAKLRITQVYFKRWLILAVFCMITLLNSFNWIAYGIIQDVTIAFYNASLPKGEAQQIEAVNWFSMVYMLCYIPLVFPAMFLLERKGLRLSCALGALLTFLGATIKCAAVRPDLFAVAMLGQTICAIAQAFTLGVPARLSALWFGPNEIGLATSIGVFGNQLGTALGFLIPPNIVVKGDIEFMQRRFYYLLVPVAALCALACLFSIFVVQDQPDKAPSLAQLEVRTTYESKEMQESDFRLFKTSLKNLFLNLNYCLILVSYGINTGVYYAISTLLNLIIGKYYANENEKIGIIGLILVLSGLVGAVIGGVVLDKTKAFKLITFIIYACSFGAMVLFTFTISVNIWIVFGTSFLLGFFMTGYLPVGFELAAEVTYPASEGTSCGLLNTSAQIFGIFFTYVQGRIVVTSGPLAGNLFVSGALLIGTIITAIVRSDLRRQRAINLIIEKTSHIKENISNDNKNFQIKSLNVNSE